VVMIVSGMRDIEEVIPAEPQVGEPPSAVPTFAP